MDQHIFDQSKGCCDAPACSIINSCTDVDVPNIPCFPQTAKVPVVVAEPTLQVCVQANIKLECPAIEIKRVRKDAFISGCKLLPTGHKCIFKLFVTGMIRKNIEYATIDTANCGAVCGDIRHTTVRLPYSACTELQFPPTGPFPIFTKTDECFAEFLDCCGKGPNLDNKLFENSVYYNEKPYCELVCVNFHEYDCGVNKCCIDGCESTFDTLNEHIVMDLKLKVLQLQSVPITTIKGGCCTKSCTKGCNTCR